MMMTDIETLRYPIGKYSVPSSVSEDDIKRWIQTLEQLPLQMRGVVKNLDDARLDTPYRDGGWTIRQVVHHVSDSHINAYCRFKLALTEENPTIRPYLEARWAELADSKNGAIEISLDILESVHKRWVLVLRNMDESDFKRTFYHPENKTTRTLGAVLCLYDWHSRHHLAHITELIKRKGWM